MDVYLSTLLVVFFLLFSNNDGFLLDSVLPTSIFVSLHGSDSNTGLSSSHPLKNIQTALNRISSLSKSDNNDVIVELLDGHYELTSPLHVVNRGNRHVTIKAYQGGNAHIVLHVNLTDVGISDYGHIKRFGFGSSSKNNLEVFVNGSPYRLARYPNKGYLNVKSVFPDGKTFQYLSDRPKHWDGENHIWCHGFWYWSWADFGHKVTYINPNNYTATLEVQPKFGMRVGHYDVNNPTAARFGEQGGYFRFINILDELDEPGEYFVDVDTGMLYLWPMVNHLFTSTDEVYVSTVDNCIEVSGGSHDILFEDVTVEVCRQHGVIGYNVANVSISKTQIRNTGSYAVVMRGTNLKVTQSDIRNTNGGINLRGGDVPTLTPSGNVIADNLITSMGRTAYTSSWGISIDGVGCHVHHNILHKGSYTGVHWNGNDHIMEYNHVTHMCLEASDCGAFQAGRSYSARGNQIRFNHIRNTKRLLPGANVRGVMLDDELSGVNISYNVFADNDIQCNIGGGRDNIITQNIMFNTSQESMHFDARGLGSGSHTEEMLEKLKKLPYTNSLWTARYPKLAALAYTNSIIDAPEGNLISENIFQSEDKRHIIGDYRTSWFNVTQNVYVSETTNFYAPEYGDFRPRCVLDEFVKRIGFKSPVLPSSLGPRFSVGPTNSNIKLPDLGYLQGAPPTPTACTKHPPSSPLGSTNLPDGSVPNVMFNLTSKTGCWFSIDSCPNDHSLERKHRPANNQLYRDISAEHRDLSGDLEHACLGKVSKMVQKCGANSSFAVIFAPTGAATLGGDGCFVDRPSCPLHNNHSSLSRDVYAEQHDNASFIENNCLKRALGTWIWCGRSPKYPITSIYRPTGKKVTAGVGCYIRPEKCPADPGLSRMFYDGEGAANFATDISKASCFQRAEDFWRHCGSDARYKVTAFFRQDVSSRTYP